jgi:hypothetical protein
MNVRDEGWPAPETKTIKTIEPHIRQYWARMTEVFKGFSFATARRDIYLAITLMSSGKCVESVEDVAWAWQNGARYVGLAPEKSSHKRSSAYAVKLNPERALFPVEFLESVSLVYSRRSEAAQTLGGNPNRFQYALNGLVRCAHCQKSFWGKVSHGVHCYRHQDRVSCTCTRRILPAHKVERDVEAILQVLKLKDVDALTKAVTTLGDHKPSKDFAKEIDQCQRRMKAALRLFRDGQIDEQEYDSTLTQNREWIAEYEQKSNSISEKTNRISAAADTMNHLNMAWHGASSKTRQDIAKSIFKWIEYDLDTQRIVEFELKPWVNEVMEVLGNLAPYYAPGGLLSTQTIQYQICCPISMIVPIKSLLGSIFNILGQPQPSLTICQKQSVIVKLSSNFLQERRKLLLRHQWVFLRGG